MHSVTVRLFTTMLGSMIDAYFITIPRYTLCLSPVISVKATMMIGLYEMHSF